MQYGFNHQQFDADVQAISNFFIKFIKSFGKSPKKIQDREVGFFEEIYIRFRLFLVEQGISWCIRSGIIIIVALFLYFTVFRHADVVIKTVIGTGFLLYYIWLFMPHIADGAKWKDGKIDGGKTKSMIDKYLVQGYNYHVDVKNNVSKNISSGIANITPNFLKNSDKK